MIADVVFGFVVGFCAGFHPQTAGRNDDGVVVVVDVVACYHDDHLEAETDNVAETDDVACRKPSSEFHDEA